MVIIYLHTEVTNERRQMRERCMFLCLISMFCHEYFERHKIKV